MRLREFRFIVREVRKGLFACSPGSLLIADHLHVEDRPLFRGVVQIDVRVGLRRTV